MEGPLEYPLEGGEIETTATSPTTTTTQTYDGRPPMDHVQQAIDRLLEQYKP